MILTLSDATIYFFGWTLLIYWCHRGMHETPLLWNVFHRDHHAQVDNATTQGPNWKNLFLFTDSWESTADMWLAEVIPTMLYAWAFDCWWLVLFYYVWAAFFQEWVEHHPTLDWYPFLTSGRWHLIHHRFPNRNFGLFTPLWDIVFETERNR